jgi:MATE family, multidrug efflux pump
MNVERSTDLEWQHAPLPALLRLAWPITISTLSYSIMTLVDTLLVGRLGSAELAGVGLAGTASFVLLCFGFGLLRGVKALVSHAIGAGRDEEVGGHLGAALVYAVALGVISLAVSEAVARALPLLAATPAAGEHARVYLAIRSLAMPLALVQVAVREVRYGEGDAQSPMWATVAANAVNIALAWTFVYGLKLGVAGAAWATVIATVVEAGVLVAAQARRGFHVRRMRTHHLRALWNIGLPTAIQFALEVGAFAMLAAMVSSMSETEMAAHQIALQVIQFSFLPAFAVGEAGSVLAGQAVGADRDALVRRVARLAMLVVAAYTGTCTLALALCAPAIVAGFAATGALAATAVRLLHVAAVFQVFDGANIVARCALRGTGDARFPAVVGVVTSWALTPPLTWWLGRRLGLGAFGGWLGLCAEIILASTILWWRLERRGWLAAAHHSRAQLARAA